jgi:hypothetical protein
MMALKARRQILWTKQRKGWEMALSAVHDEVISMSFGPITAEHIQDFAAATCSVHFQGTPLTFPTVFRATEFRWLDRLQLDMQKLLHTEQEYEYVSQLKEGDTLNIATRITEYRQRRGLLFVTLETDVVRRSELVMKGRSAFVVRQEAESPSGEGGN